MILVGRPDACAEMRQTSNLSPWAVFREGREINTSIRFRIKIVENRSDDASRASRAKKTRFFRLRTRLGVNFGRLGPLRSVPGRLFGRPGPSLGTLLELPGLAGDAPETLRDGSGTSLSATGRPEWVLGPILSRFWEPQGCSRDRFWIDFRIDFRAEFCFQTDRGTCVAKVPGTRIEILDRISCSNFLNNLS